MSFHSGCDDEDPPTEIFYDEDPPTETFDGPKSMYNDITSHIERSKEEKHDSAAAANKKQ